MSAGDVEITPAPPEETMRCEQDISVDRGTREREKRLFKSCWFNLDLSLGQKFAGECCCFRYEGTLVKTQTQRL